MILTANEFCDDIDKYLDLVNEGKTVIIDYENNLYSIESFNDLIDMDSVHNEPNEATLEAIKEACSGKFAGTINTSSMKDFTKSCE
jgi:hypothetical protein